MTLFFLGQTVKLARPFYPENEGEIGVIEYLGAFGPGEIIGGRMTSMAGDCIVRFQNHDLCQQFTHQLEPLTPKHEPCETDFKESLDKLLSEVRDREAV